MIYVIGPSHLHEKFTKVIDHELKQKTLFPNCALTGIWGVPNWSIELHTHIQNAYKKYKTVVWLVSEYKLHNFEYPELLKLPDNELYYNSQYVDGAISKSYMTPEHIHFLGNHTLKVVDDVIRKYPNIKLIFWCLYKRTKANSNSSYPRDLWYDSIKTRYKANILDIDNFTTPREFNRKLRDDSAHPNKDGYILLDTMIRSLTTSDTKYH